MHRPSANDILKDHQSYYSLVIGVAKRAREITDEVEQSGEILVEKPVQVAVEQFARGEYRLIEKSNLGKELE